MGPYHSPRIGYEALNGIAAHTCLSRCADSQLDNGGALVVEATVTVGALSWTTSASAELHTVNAASVWLPGHWGSMRMHVPVRYLTRPAHAIFVSLDPIAPGVFLNLYAKPSPANKRY